MKRTIWIGVFSALLAGGLVNAAESEKKEEKKTAGPADLTDPSKLTEKAPDTFKARFETTKGSVTIEVTRSLSPNGADRF